jgi:hypothetical protein
MAKADPIFLVIKRREMREKETEREAANPFGVPKENAPRAHPTSVRQRMYDVKRK